MSTISVIVPIFNSEKTLNRCVDSIVSQTYFNLEIILVNDGSVDKSDLICKNYTELDNRVKVINQINKGVSEARNTGLRNATGEFVLFIDSDDFIDEYMVEKLANVAKRKKSDLVISGFKEYCIEGSSIKLIGTHVSSENSTLNPKEFSEEFSRLYSKRLLSGPCNSLYILKIVKENNILFNPNLSYGEDTLFNLEYFRFCSIISVLNESFYNYVHVNATSLSQRYNPDKLHSLNMIYDRIREMFSLKDLYNQEGIKEIEIIYFYHITKCVEELLINSNGNSKRNNIIKSANILSDPRVLNAVMYRKDFKNLNLRFLANLNYYHMIKTEIFFIAFKSSLKKILSGVMYGRK